MSGMLAILQAADTASRGDVGVNTAAAPSLPPATTSASSVSNSPDQLALMVAAASAVSDSSPAASAEEDSPEEQTSEDPEDEEEDTSEDEEIEMTQGGQSGSGENSASCSDSCSEDRKGVSDDGSESSINQAQCTPVPAATSSSGCSILVDPSRIGLL